MAKVNGTNLLVYYGPAGSEVLIAAGTGYTLDVKEDLIDATTKDSTGKWKENIEGEKSFTLSVDFLYDTNPGTDKNFDDLITLITTADNNDVSIVCGDKTTSGSKYYSGNVRMSAISWKANKNEAAAGSATFEGNGALSVNTVV
jgi:TP901-1 family phage major tail protein